MGGGSVTNATDRAALAGAAPVAEADTAALRAWTLAVATGAFLRLVIAPFSEDQWGDAPVRLEFVQRWVESPGLWWGYDRVYQFGPLPTHLAGLLARAGLGVHWGARLVALVGGVSGVALIGRVAARFGGPGAGAAAAWALALSPMHLQASTTFASEAIFVAFALACIDRALSRDALGTALFAFAVSTTRYDAWLWLPLLAAWWVLTAPAGARVRAALVSAAFFLGPLSILAANAFAIGDPMRPLDHISDEHVMLAAGSQEHHGVWPWRLAMLAYWPLSFVVSLTPGFAVAVLLGVIDQVRRRGRALFPVLLGLAPPASYVARTLLGTFWPMARFALAPAALCAVAIRPLGPRALAACIALAVATNLVFVSLADGQPGWGVRASAMSPLSRISTDLRRGAEVLRESEDVVLDKSPHYDDILVAHTAGRDRFKLQWTRRPAPQRIVSLRGGPLDAELREQGRAMGAEYRLAGEQGRVAWWDRVGD